MPSIRTHFFINSQRRYIAENKYNNLSYLSSIRLSLEYLLKFNKNIPKPNTAIVFNGGLSHKVNAGIMLSKITNNGLTNFYNIENEFFFTRSNSIKVFGTFTSRILYFTINIIKCIPYLYTLKKQQLINYHEIIAIMLYKNAFFCYLLTLVKDKNIKFFLTYNDYLSVSAELSASFRFWNKNVYHIQHGILSEINYPGLSNHFILWGDSSLRKALKLGYTQETLKVIGSACFNEHQKSSSQLYKKIFLFFSQTNLIEHTGLNICTEVKNWIYNCALDHPEFIFIIRLHPNEQSNTFYSDYEHIKNINIEYATTIDIEKSIQNASVCGTIWSGAAIDTMVQKKPLVIFNPLNFDKNKELTSLGCYEANSYKTFSNFIKRIDDPIYRNKILKRQENALNHEIAQLTAETLIASYILNEETKK